MLIDARDSHSSPQSRVTFSWFLLISANVLWAASYVAGKLALQTTLVILMLALRMGISALILLPFLVIKRRELKLSPKNLPQLVLLSCIGWLALMATVFIWFQSLVQVDASVAASTLFIQSLLGTLLAIVPLDDQLTLMTIMGGLLIIISVYVISRQ